MSTSRITYLGGSSREVSDGMRDKEVKSDGAAG
jgi:hypothetical protein